MPVCPDQTFVFHPFDFSHHGAPVHRQIVGQSAVGEGEQKGAGMFLLCQQAEIALQLFPGGALAQHLQPFAQVNRFLGDHLKGVVHQTAVEGTGFGTALDQMAIVDELDPASGCADHLHGGGIFRDKGQGFAENISRSQLLQDRLTAVQMGAQKLHRTLQNDADLFTACPVGAYQLSVVILLFHRMEAYHHFPVIFLADALK